MTWLVWSGTVFAIIGLAGVVYCIYAAFSAKRSGLDDSGIRDRLQRVVAINMAALLASALGLMAVVIGVMLT